MTFQALLEQETVTQVSTKKPVSGPLHNLDTIVVDGQIDPKPYLTGIFIECIAPNGNLVLADVVDIPAGETAYEDSFVLGAPANTPEGPNWTTGTYTFKLFWNPANGPSIPLTATATFTYQA